MKGTLYSVMSTVISSTAIIPLNGVFNQQQEIGKENTETNINHSWKDNFGKENVEKDINYRWKADYKTWTSDSSNTYELINWKDIADIKYIINGFSYYFPTFVIDGTMSCGLYGGFGYISQYYSSKTALLSGTTNTIQFTCNAFVGPEHYTAIILKLWTSGTSIYWKWDAFFKGNGTSYIDINLKKVTFMARFETNYSDS